MKSGLKKISFMLTVIFMLSSVLVGCGSHNTPKVENSSDKSKEVTLKMYLLGDKSKDFDLVYGEINKLLKKDINATVDVKFMGWGDYEQKYPLVFASGEDFDVIYTANWAFYNSQATKGGFMEITKDMLEKYAPKTAQTMYKDAWEQAKVNGKVYMLPMNYKELYGYVYMVRGDLMEKYGMTEIKSLQDFQKYLEAVTKNDKDLIPVDVGSEFDQMFAFERVFETFDSVATVGTMQLGACMGTNDSSYKAMHIADHPDFLQTVKKMKEWKDKGYWSKSAVINKTTNKESFLNGKSACAILNLNDARGQYNSIAKAHPEWKLRVFDAQEGAKRSALVTPYIGNGMAIAAQSKNKERALMFLDLLKNDERYADLIAYGIKGKHYESVSEGKIKPLADTVNYPIDGNCNWGLRNDKFWKNVEGGMPNYSQIYDKWLKNPAKNPVATFNFDDSNVKNEVASMCNIYKTDFKALVLGYTNDPEADVKKLQEKLKIAGKDKVIEEMQKQIKATLNK